MYLLSSEPATPFTRSLSGSPGEIKNLKRGVRQQNQDLLVQQLMEHFQQTGDSNLTAFNKEMEKIRNMSDTELESDVSHIDWEKLSKIHVSVFGVCGNSYC